MHCCVWGVGPGLRNSQSEFAQAVRPREIPNFALQDRALETFDTVLLPSDSDAVAPRIKRCPQDRHGHLDPGTVGETWLPSLERGRKWLREIEKNEAAWCCLNEISRGGVFVKCLNVILWFQQTSRFRRFLQSGGLMKRGSPSLPFSVERGKTTLSAWTHGNWMEFVNRNSITWLTQIVCDESWRVPLVDCWVFLIGWFSYLTLQRLSLCWFSWCSRQPDQILK